MKLEKKPIRIKINDIPVELPYEPYIAQTITMTKIITAIQTGASALIESPTGTGKSIAILCSTLAYLEALREKKPKIYIASRTHKQIDQLVNQLKQTTYRPRICILASRANYCIYPVSGADKDKNKDQLCSDLVKKKACIFFDNRFDFYKKCSEHVLDIEELKVAGRKQKGCPFYASRLMADNADIIFAPYNYLVDPRIRRSLDIKLENSVVIIDEAHNLEDFCRNAGSIVLTSNKLEYLLQELNGVLRNAFELKTIDKFRFIYDSFLKIREYGLVNLQTASSNRSSYNTKIDKGLFKGDDIIPELNKMGLYATNISVFCDAVSIIKESEERDELSVGTLSIIDDFCSTAKCVLCEKAVCYAMSLETSYEGYSISIYLLDPSFVFSGLASSVKSIILLSGTLTPFASFSSEFNHKFGIMAEAPHIITDNVFVAHVDRGPSDQLIVGTYANSRSESYLVDIMAIISKISLTIGSRGGILVFVSSYAFLDVLKKRSPVGYFFEPRTGNFDAVMKNYTKNVRMGKPSVFVCVFRGRASEGMDFRDSFCRAVVSVGIPYPNSMDKEVICKKEYNDKHQVMKGNMWYETQAYRAVNQALGRVIRHKDDYGAVFLVDSRYNRAKLSSWVRDRVRKFKNFDEINENLKKFLHTRK